MLVDLLLLLLGAARRTTMNRAKIDRRMGTHHASRARKLTRAAFRRWNPKRKPNSQPSRELRRSW